MKAIIYRRFSSKEQGKGSTLTRQSELCETYCASQGWPVVEVVTDEGVSAWSGANITSGNLAKLTQRLVNEGGSGIVIVVEQLDRITRRPPNEVINWLTNIATAGASLATVNDQTVIDADSFALNPMNTMMLVFNAYRAFSESQAKSDRVGAAWAKKREAIAEKPMTRTTVGWVRMEDGKLVLHEDRAAIVRRIFDLTLAGWNPARIAETLNIEGVPTFNRSNGWHISYVRKILANRAVIGEYQPHRHSKGSKRVPVGDPIPDYYPAVVNERDFRRVQQRKVGTTRSAARQHSNLLSGLCRCTMCGGTMTFISKGVRRPGGKAYEYFRCEASRRGMCEGKRPFPYRPTLDAILDRLTLNLPVEMFQDESFRIAELEGLRAGLERERDDKELKATRLIALVEEGDELAVERYRRFRADGAGASEALQKLDNDIANLRAAIPSSEHLEVVQEVRDRIETSVEARAKLKAALDWLLETVHFDPELGEFWWQLSKAYNNKRAKVVFDQLRARGIPTKMCMQS